MGMTFDEINNKFLLIGRKRRNTHFVEITPKGRKVTGRKGLGKLALFGIGHHMKIISCKGGEQVEFDLDWDDIKNKVPASIIHYLILQNVTIKNTVLQLF